MKKEVSVIIPCFNNEKYLEEAVLSCLKQEYLFEIIIIDDFSTDNSFSTAEVLRRRYSNIIKLFRNFEKGGNNARNFGFEQAKGTFIQWLDADDILLPGKFKEQVNRLCESGADIAYSQGFLETFNSANELIQKEELNAHSHEDYLLELLQDNWLPLHAYLLRYETASRLHKHKAWNPLTKAAQDREYFTKAAIKGARFVFVSGKSFVYKRRLGENSVSRKFTEKEKFAIVILLLQGFKKDILVAPSFALFQKDLYSNVIDTQILYYAAVYDFKGVSLTLSLFEIRWKAVSGIRSKFKMLRYVLSNNHLFSPIIKSGVDLSDFESAQEHVTKDLIR